MNPNIHTIFTFSLVNDKKNTSLEKLFSKYSKKIKKGIYLVYNVSLSKKKLNKIIDIIIHTAIIYSIDSFKIYCYYPSIGFKVFILKKPESGTINIQDVFLLKQQINSMYTFVNIGIEYANFETI